MPAKLLIPLDGSDGSRQAVEYVARTFGQTPGVEIRLIHVLPEIPPSLWDNGHILNEAERADRQAQISDWEKDRERQWEALFAQACDELHQAGIPSEAISTKFTPKYSDVADDILDEAIIAGYSTIVIGRRGLTGAKKILLGSISSKIVHHAKGIAVLIVDHTHPKEFTDEIPPTASSDKGFWQKFIYLSKYY